MTETEATLLETDWETRTLCSDESCIGTIGADGRCRICGVLWRPGEAVSSSEVVSNGAAGSEDADDWIDEPDLEMTDHDRAAPDEECAAWDNRRLCPDESCIGVIGPDGRCGVCGRVDGSPPQS